MDNETVRVIGGCLASGFSNEEIIAQLVVSGHSREEAVDSLQGVYKEWRDVDTSLSLDTTDLQNWHSHLRLHLLKKTLKDGSIQAGRLALNILDSLASLQGLQQFKDEVKVQPIAIILKSKEKEEEK